MPPDVARSLAQASQARERLVEAAYALHFACVDAAAVVELQLPPDPRLFDPDGVTGPQRWRRVGELALAVARAWDQTELPEGPRPPVDPVTNDVLEAADKVVRRLFATGMRMNNLATLVDGQVGTRIQDAAEDIDKAILEIRRTAVDLTTRADRSTVTGDGQEE